MAEIFNTSDFNPEPDNIASDISWNHTITANVEKLGTVVDSTGPVQKLVDEKMDTLKKDITDTRGELLLNNHKTKQYVDGVKEELSKADQYLLVNNCQIRKDMNVSIAEMKKEIKTLHSDLKWTRTEFKYWMGVSAIIYLTTLYLFFLA